MSLTNRLRLLSGFHAGHDLVERLTHAIEGQKQQQEALLAAADEIDRLQQRWTPLAESEPNDQRVLVVRELPDGARYVDVMTWVAEPDSGLPPLVSKQHVTHWMPLPEPPKTRY